jgi:uncharacterized protein (DUF305 family)
VATKIEPTHAPAADDAEFAALSGKAEQCRRLAAGISDRQAAEVLRSMAERYQQNAERLSRR